MIDKSELLEAKRLHGWVILVADEEKNPSISGRWKSYTTQTEEELQQLLKRVGDRASCWGPVCGLGELFSFDFDWPFIFGLWFRHFEERALTLTYETPNMGARPFFLTNEKTKGDPFERSLHTEFKQNHFVACGGHAHNINGELRPYVKTLDQPIRRDDKIIQDSTRFFHDLLKGRYSWLQYKCIRERMSSKRIVLNHKQGLAINSFMMTKGCEDWEIHNFRKNCFDIDEFGKHRLEYDRKTTQTQIDSGRKYIEGGGKPFPCSPTDTNEGLVAVFNFDPQNCEGCPRRTESIRLPKKKVKKKDFMPLVLGLLSENYTFATPDDVEVLYLYRDGVYVPGETTIKGDVEAILGDDGNTGFCNEVINHFKRRSYVPRDAFNRFEGEIPVLNGLLNLETMQLGDFDPEKIFTFKIDTNFDQSKDCPKFKKTLKQILPKDDERKLIQEYAGYTLWPSFPHHKFMVFIGTGRNGKGTIIRTLEGIIGKDNVSNIRLEHLTGGHRFMVANLFGKLMNVCSEPSTRRPFKTEMLKQITGQDTIDGEIKNKQKPLKFTPFAKFFIQANKLPVVDDTTLSFWDRINIVEFTETFTDEKKNKVVNIEDTWLNNEDERSGILNWMIAGLKRLKENGKFTQTKSREQQILKFKQVSDPIGAFLTDPEECIHGSVLWVTNSGLYNAYKDYAEEHGVAIESSRVFTGRVTKLPGVIARFRKIGKKSTRIWKGISTIEKGPVLDDFDENGTDDTDDTDILPCPENILDNNSNNNNIKYKKRVRNNVSSVSSVSPSQREPSTVIDLNPEKQDAIVSDAVEFLSRMPDQKAAHDHYVPHLLRKHPDVSEKAIKALLWNHPDFARRDAWSLRYRSKDMGD